MNRWTAVWLLKALGSRHWRESGLQQTTDNGQRTTDRLVFSWSGFISRRVYVFYRVKAHPCVARLGFYNAVDVCQTVGRPGPVGSGRLGCRGGHVFHVA